MNAGGIHLANAIDCREFSGGGICGSEACCSSLDLLDPGQVDPTSFEWRAAGLTVLACALAFGLNWSVLRLLGATAIGGTILVLAF